MYQPSSMFVAGDISQTILGAFFWTPCMTEMTEIPEITDFDKRLQFATY